MLRLSVLLVLLVALAPALTAQPGADSALVVQIYADLARGDVPAVAAVPEAVTTEDGRVVVVGTARRADPATGQFVAARFRHVWQVHGRRVVSVHRSHDGPYRPPSDPCDLKSC